MENHVVLMEYNELSIEISDFYAKRGEKVLLLDLDPDITDHFEHEHGHSNIHAHYANMQDPDVWENLAFDKAKVVISCMDAGQEAEMGMARWLKKNAPDVPFLAATSSHQETLELYDAGTRYVIQTEFLAARSFHEMLASEMAKSQKDAFREAGQKHLEETRKIQEGLGDVFAKA